jgi:glycosyltransferase involved in cell wall biosynthesis
VGNGPEKKTLELLAENLGLQERVIFLSSYVDMPGLLAEAGAIIFPSKEKELDSAFVPGLLSGLPVITSDIPGVEEMIRNEENGLMVRKQDSDELAAAMKLIASDPELRASLQKNSRKGIERFSVSAHCAKILSLVQQPVKK